MAKLTLGAIQRELKKGTFSLIQTETANIILKDNNIIFQKQDELTVGQNPDGSDIGEYSSSEMGQDYRLFKMQINPLAGGKVDLILTGSTKNKMRVVNVGKSTFMIESQDEKWRGLVNKYGDQIRGISETAFIQLQKNVYGPKLNQNLKQIIKL